MNYALIVDIIMVFITIATGFLPIVLYGQYMTYSPASTESWHNEVKTTAANFIIKIRSYEMEQ